MQVFVAYAKPEKNVNCLDLKRRNKQILEIIQIIAVNNNIYPIIKNWKIVKPLISGVKNRYKTYKYIKNHPTTKKWKGNEDYLIRYLDKLFIDYRNRKGIDHKALEQFKIIQQYLSNNCNRTCNNTYGIDFLTPEFCRFNQNLLLFKNKEHYSKYF